MSAKLSDFGLAKLLMQDQTRTFTALESYCWKSYAVVGVWTGIFLLKAIIEQWVYQCFQAGDIGILVGDEEVDLEQLERVVSVGLWCIQYEPSLRPSMKKVQLMLEGIVDVPLPLPASFFDEI
ncbi:hypothetical protein PTKIN_Ptkin07bG0090000 [Pterospermum kingtungense]